MKISEILSAEIALTRQNNSVEVIRQAVLEQTKDLQGSVEVSYTSDEGWVVGKYNYAVLGEGDQERVLTLKSHRQLIHEEGITEIIVDALEDMSSMLLEDIENIKACVQ